MKKALLYSPLAAAILFTIPQAWQLVNDPGPDYVPVVYEALVLVFSWLAAALINIVIVVPLCWFLIRLKKSGLIAGIITGLVIALVGDTIAYAFEIFDYQSSIFNPAYLYPVFIPLLALSFLTFFFMTRMQPVPQKSVDAEEGQEAAEK